MKQKHSISVHTGFTNKGNIYCINLALQALDIVTSFLHQFPSQSPTISPLVRTLTLNMSLPKDRSSPIDPSNFHRAFEILISKKGGTTFNIDTHHDVPEII